MNNRMRMYNSVQLAMGTAGKKACENSFLSWALTSRKVPRRSELKERVVTAVLIASYEKG